MHKFFLALLLIGLTGCAFTTKTQYGYFSQNTNQANDKKIINDVVKKLVLLYPPASTRFDFQHTSADFFGTHLIESMRAKGYAVMEFRSKAKSNAAIEQYQAKPSLPLSYIVDQPEGSDSYRVTLIINRQQSLNRAYRVAPNGVIFPAGYWVRKE